MRLWIALLILVSFSLGWLVGHQDGVRATRSRGAAHATP